MEHSIVKFYEIVNEAVKLLEEYGRISYAGLEAQFSLDETQMQALKQELIMARRIAYDEDSTVLVYCGAKSRTEASSHHQMSISKNVSHAPTIQETERKVVTVLSVDIKNSTGLVLGRDPEEAERIVAPVVDAMKTAVQRFECDRLEGEGDGFMAFFGLDRAENHSDRACRAALEIQTAVRKFGTECAGEGARGVQVRVGLGTGEVATGASGLWGDTMIIAKRMQEAAPPGGILLTRETFDLVAGFNARRVGLVHEKGVTVDALELIGEEPPVKKMERGGSPLVGREAEMALFTAQIDKLKQCEGGVLFVAGEAGVGKSRLVAEVRALSEAEDLLWLEGKATRETQSISYDSFIKIFKAWSGITDEDTEEGWYKLERAFERLLPGQVSETLPYIGTMLALPIKDRYRNNVAQLDGETRKFQLFRSCRLFFQSLVREHKLVLVFEDWHWVDPSSIDLLQHLLPLVLETPLLIVCVIRTEGETTSEGQLENVRLDALPRRLVELVANNPRLTDRYTEIKVRPLFDHEADQLFRKLLPTEGMSSRSRNEILTKTQGNPFFLEEIVRTLKNRGHVLPGKKPGTYFTTPGIDQISIPTKVRDLVADRVRLLDEDTRDVLQKAAVIGRTFFYVVLEEILKAEDRDKQYLDHQLGSLLDQELIREKDVRAARRAAAELEYMFRHAVAQEAVYRDISIAKRRYLHGDVAKSIIALFPDRLDEFYGRLAYHYVRAGNSAEAHKYLIKAGDQASYLAADEEALDHYERALQIYDREFGDQGWASRIERASLERKMSEALLRRGKHKEAEEHLVRALNQLGRSLPETPTRVRLALIGQVIEQVGHRLLPWIFVSRRTSGGQVGFSSSKSLEFVHIYEVLSWIDYVSYPERFALDSLRQLNLAERQRLWSQASFGAFTVGIMCDILPRFGLPNSRIAKHYYAKALRLAEDPRMTGYANLGLGAHGFYIGEWQTALKRLRLARHAFRRAHDLRGMGAAIATAARLHVLHGNFTLAWKFTGCGLKWAESGGDEQSMAWNLCVQAIVLCARGDIEVAIDKALECRELSSRILDYNTVAMAGGILGHCYLRQGKPLKALGVLKLGLRVIQSRKLQGFQCTHALMYLAEARIALAEKLKGDRKTLRRAARTASAALKQSKIDSEGFVVAARARGTIAWLAGDHTRAYQWWKRSIENAQALEAPYEEALTMLESGRLSRDASLVERSLVAFESLDAKLDRARAVTVLQCLQRTSRSSES